jgi:hypothetical protein
MACLIRDLLIMFEAITNIKRKANAPVSNRRGSFFKPFIQPKFTIDQPGHPDSVRDEQEADTMAEKVMRMKEPAEQNFFPPAIIQRTCANCEEEEKELQRKENGEPTGASSQTENYISSLSGGENLRNEEKNFFESRMGYDFSHVKIHKDNSASESAKNLNALAYTTENNIVFGSGQYRPDTDDGKKLLAHELTHVVQQRNYGVNRMVQRHGLVEGWIAHLAALKSKISSLAKDGSLTISLFDDGAGKIGGYQLEQKFSLILDKTADASQYAIVQWITGEIYEEKSGGKVYWPANAAGALYGRKSTDPWRFTDWIIDSPDADPRLGSHRGLKITVPKTDFDDAPGIIMKSGTMPAGLHYKVDARVGVYAWGWPVPTSISDWETMKPEPFSEIKWGWDIVVKPDQKSLDVLNNY